MDNNNTMEYRIGLEKQNKRNDQVTELILDNCRASQISGLTDEFVNLESLSLINVGLTTLKGFPRLPQLKKLELSDNRLTGGLDLLHGSLKLEFLNISGNRIKDFEALEPLKEFHELRSLDLYNCDVTRLEGYRQKVFELLPKIASLDGLDQNDVEVAESDESEEEFSDVENCISRNDLDDDDDDEEEGDSESDYDDEEGDLGGMNYEEGDVDDEEDEDEEDDGDEDDDEGDNEEYAIENQIGDREPADITSGNAESVENGAEESGIVALEDGETIDDEDDDDEDDEDEDDDDDEDEEEDEGEGSDLKQLEKEIGEDESEDDDFEPTGEPEERDYEIDPEDDVDEDETSAILSTSNDETAAISTEVVEQKQRGEKRKHEDEGGDEVDEE